MKPAAPKQYEQKIKDKRELTRNKKYTKPGNKYDFR